MSRQTPGSEIKNLNLSKREVTCYIKNILNVLCVVQCFNFYESFFNGRRKAYDRNNVCQHKVYESTNFMLSMRDSATNNYNRGKVN